jgi:hypothetical protein
MYDGADCVSSQHGGRSGTWTTAEQSEPRLIRTAEPYRTCTDTSWTRLLP